MRCLCISSLCPWLEQGTLCCIASLDPGADGYLWGICKAVVLCCMWVAEYSLGSWDGYPDDGYMVCKGPMTRDGTCVSLQSRALSLDVDSKQWHYLLPITELKYLSYYHQFLLICSSPEAKWYSHYSGIYFFVVGSSSNLSLLFSTFNSSPLSYIDHLCFTNILLVLLWLMHVTLPKFQAIALPTVLEKPWYLCVFM